MGLVFPGFLVAGFLFSIIFFLCVRKILVVLVLLGLLTVIYLWAEELKGFLLVLRRFMLFILTVVV